MRAHAVPHLAETSVPIPRRRRRQSNSVRTRKSFSLQRDLVAALEQAVALGLAANASAFVELAVEEKLRRAKRAILYAAYEEAARDPRFMAEVAEIGQAFDAVAADGMAAESAAIPRRRSR